ncbi:MAG: hypothetical protein H8M99_09515 [Gloeobacteraceae cyanobacterium ES-bin-144]|nr:hypothetical protein [Verrucomicrobiales bacterium]
MKRIALIATILILIGGLLVWWFTPEQILKRRTESLLDTLTLKSSSSKTSRQVGAYSLDGLLADEVVLESTTITEANGTFDRSEIQSAFSALCEHANQTQFELQKFQSITIRGDEADVVFSLKALVELPSSRPVDGRFNVTYHWKHGNKGWQLTRANWVEAKP